MVALSVRRLTLDELLHLSRKTMNLRFMACKFIGVVLHLSAYFILLRSIFVFIVVSSAAPVHSGKVSFNFSILVIYLSEEGNHEIYY